MARTRSKANRKRGSPSLCTPERSKRCDCGSKTDKLVCEMDVSCDSCGRCLRGCSSNNDCTETHDKEANDRDIFVQGWKQE